MPLPVQIADYTVLDKPPYLIEYFQGTDLAAYAAAMDTQYDQIEQACFDLISQLWLDNAIGAQLDVLGVQLNLPRAGLDDTTYRLLLQLKAFIDQGAGTPEAAIAAVRTIMNDPAPAYLALWPELPAAFAVASPSPLGIGQLFDLLDNLGDNIVDNNGNNIDVGTFSPLTPAQIATIAPAGVAMMTGDDLIDNLLNNIVDNNGNLIAVLAFAAVP